MNILVKFVVFLVLLNLAIGLAVWLLKKLFFFGLIAALVYFLYRTFWADCHTGRYHV
ncbi:MAG: hypothetical protein NW226_07060 [Microscillaceae bacterium]|nr:hypothetical protein [Microscillaceae bacterium]